ncbi:MAG: hypothetical protein SFW67_21355 [Myxococcaceae bacterium]|nr:hypothetical protein [Myxococcaceae bacterium]
MVWACVWQLLVGNIAASRAEPATAGVEWSPDVAVKAETLDFVCGLEQGEPSCRFFATYELEPLTAEPPAIDVRFVGTKTSDVVLELDGARVTGSVRIGQRSRLIARGVIHPGQFVEPSYARSAMSVRHPLFGAPVHRSHRFDFEYAIAPIRTFAGPPPKVTLHVEYRRAGRSRSPVTTRSSRPSGAAVKRSWTPRHCSRCASACRCHRRHSSRAAPSPPWAG